MKILVCIEEGREQDSGNGDDVALWYDERGVALRLHAENDHPLDQALRLKGESDARTHVTLLCIGPKRAEEAVRRGLALGCDRGVHVLDSEEQRSDVAGIIEGVCRKTSFDLILTGAGLGEAGAKVASRLGCLSASGVAAVYGDGGNAVRCELADERQERHFKVPLVLICRRGPAIMRLPTLRNLLSSRKRAIIVYRPAELLSGQGCVPPGISSVPPGLSVCAGRA